MRKQSDHTRAVMDELDKQGAVVRRIENGGKHARIYFSIGGKEFFHTLSGSPGDRRSALNARSQVRRLCKQARTND